MCSNNICIEILKTWELYDWVLVLEVWKTKEGRMLYANALIHKIILSQNMSSIMRCQYLGSNDER